MRVEAWVIAAVGLCVGASGAGLWRLYANDSHPDAYRADGLDSSGQAVDCESVPTRFKDACRTIDVEGATVRYALISGEPASADGAVLLDLGGPGVAALGPNGASDVLGYLREGIGDRPVIILEEPWVTAPESERCWKAGRRYVEQVLVEGTRAADLQSSCFEETTFGWTPALYAQAVRRILERHGMALEGFIGVSFASVRLSYLHVQPQWAILNSPFPLNLSLKEILTHQRPYVERNAARLMALGEPTDPRTLHAVSLGLVEADEDELDRTRAELPTLARRAIGAYGSDALSLGRLAFFQEFCPIAGPPPRSSGEDSDALLNAVFSPCRDVARVSRTIQIPTTTCVVYSHADRQIPPDTMAAWARDIGARSEALDGHAHGAFELFEACMDVAAGDPAPQARIGAQSG
ncbi:MAG: hypothetical protein AAF735_06595 [Myxococcota bacterium]